jgi:hypothetical protein
MKYGKLVVRLFVAQSARQAGFNYEPFLKAASQFLGSIDGSKSLKMVVVDLNKTEIVKATGDKVNDTTVDFILATPDMNWQEGELLKLAFVGVPDYIKSRSLLVMTSYSNQSVESSLNAFVYKLLNVAGV